MQVLNSLPLASGSPRRSRAAEGCCCSGRCVGRGFYKSATRRPLQQVAACTAVPAAVLQRSTDVQAGMMEGLAAPWFTFSMWFLL